MKNALQMLLSNLETIELEHSEIQDTAVREELHEALQRSFLNPEPEYQLPHYFAMFTDEGNALIQTVLLQFLSHPEINTDSVRRLTPEEREAAFYEDSDPLSNPDHAILGDYFGYV